MSIRLLKFLKGSLVNYLALAIFIASIALTIPSNVFAAGQFILSSSAGSVNNGASFSVTVRVNPGTPVTGVVTTTTFDSSKVDFLGVDHGGSAFSTTAYSNSTSNTVVLDKFNVSAIQGDLVVAKLNFKAKVGSGSTSFSVSGSTDNMGSSSSTSTGSTSVTLTTPTPNNPTPNNPTPNNPTPNNPTPNNPTPNNPTPNNPTPNNPTPTNPGVKPVTPTPINAPGAVTISDNPVNAEFTKARTQISTNNNAKVSISFGETSENLLFQTPQTGLGTSHDVVFNESVLIPGTTYYYQVVAQNANGESSYSELKSFKTKGYSLKVTIKDKDGKPLKKKKVTLFSEPMEVETSAEGVAEFSDVAPGNHNLEYTSGRTKYTQAIIVENTVQDVAGIQTAQPQNFSVVYSSLNQPLVSIKLIGTVLITLLVLVVGAYIISRRYSPSLILGSMGSRFGSNSNKTPGVITQSNNPGVNQQTQEPTPTVFTVQAPKPQGPGEVVNPTVQNNSEDDKNA